jgi:hypothetical protein
MFCNQNILLTAINLYTQFSSTFVLKVNIALQNILDQVYMNVLMFNPIYTLSLGIVVLHVMVPKSYLFPLISHSLALYQNKA